MRIRIWGLFVFMTGCLCAAPMPVKEVVFLLRQRQPESEIVAEITRRQLAEKPTPAEVDKLMAAGASTSFIKRIQAPELIARPRQPPLTPTPQPTPAPPTNATPPEQANAANPPPRTGTVGAALNGKLFAERQNTLTPCSPTAGGEPKTYLFVFTRADDTPSRKFIAVMRDRLNQWMSDSDPRPVEICRAREPAALAGHALGRGALWPLARYEVLDPRLQALCVKPETRIALVTQEWEVLVNEVAPPAELAMEKARAVVKDRYKIQLR
jgi:hypothetical protein